LPSAHRRANRIEAQFTALRYFALDGTDYTTHQEQASMIRRYIIWRNHHDDIQATVDRLKADGFELADAIGVYEEDTCRLCYVRGPEGIIDALAERIT
jgi:hypothetical protein